VCYRLPNLDYLFQTHQDLTGTTEANIDSYHFFIIVSLLCAGAGVVVVHRISYLPAALTEMQCIAAATLANVEPHCDATSF